MIHREITICEIGIIDDLLSLIQKNAAKVQENIGKCSKEAKDINMSLAIYDEVVSLAVIRAGIDTARERLTLLAKLI